MFVAYKGGRAARRRNLENHNAAQQGLDQSELVESELNESELVASGVSEGAQPALPAAEPLRARPQPRKRATPRLRVVQPQVPRGDITPKIAAFLDKVRPTTPCLVVDLDVVEQSYLAMSRALEPARVYYSLKANPAPKILKLLARLGSYFDAASRGEVDLCLSLGIDPARIAYGNTIKKQVDIAHAYEKGVRLFAFDAESELEKIAAVAPDARVCCRVLVDNVGADWPLSRKFGCAPAMAVELMLRAKALGLEAAGISFHIGSQQTDLAQWDQVLAGIAALYATLAERGVKLPMLNLGGGFPSRYRHDVPSVEDYGAAVMAATRRHFPEQPPELIVEPGRGIVGDAGVIEAEVVLVSIKEAGETRRWVYLDVGKFSGLAETMDEAIKYRVVTPHDGEPMGPVVLAGPTCDSVDILYEHCDYEMPLALKAGDKVRILSCGAYTATYSSVGFNGFPPLKLYCI
jgi:ornithine decarboxylase